MKNRPSPDVKCSRCGSQRDLALITQRYSPNCQSGRILIYCSSCIDDYKRNIHLTIPLSEVDDESFLAIYKKDLSGSDPETAVEIVFGKPVPGLVRKAEQLLRVNLEANKGSNL